jgi:hypothetical protein
MSEHATVSLMRHKANPFQEPKRRLPHKAFLRRDDPFRRVDEEEIVKACRRVAQGAPWMTYAGSRGPENGRRVFGFDTPEKARALQTWIEVSGIERRPRPEPAPDAGLLRIG